MSRPPLPIGAYGDITITRQVPDGKLASGNIRWRATVGDEAAPVGKDGKPRQRWRARARYRDKTGKVEQLQKYSTVSPAKAKQALQAALTEATQTIKRPGARLRVEDITAQWWDEKVKSEKVREQTLDQYRNTLDKHLLKRFGKLRLVELDTAAVCDGLEDIAVKATSRAKLSRVLLKQICTYAVRMGAMDVNPVTSDVPTYSNTKRNTDSLTPEQYGVIRAAVEAWQKQKHMGPKRTTVVLDILDFMYVTGCRTSEALAVRWEDIDFKACTVTFSGTLLEPRKGKPTRRQEVTKSESGYRIVYLGKTIVEMLKKRAEMEVPNEFGMVFPNTKGGYQSPNGFRTKLRDAMKLANVKGFIPYDLRKTNAKAIRDGAGIEVAQAQLGHSGPAVTKKYYTGEVHEVPDTSEITEKYLVEASSLGTDT